MSSPRRISAAVAAAAALAISVTLAATPAAASRADAITARQSATEAALRAAGQRRPPSHIAAAGVEVANAITGDVLWSRGRHVERPIASITKVMTAMVVIRSGHLSRRIRITRAEVNYVINHGASGAGLRAGDVLSVRQLLYAMLLPSGADAAMALTETYGPGLRAFVRKMNRLAARWGLTQTQFVDFDGLSAADLSTPGNLIRLGEAAMKDPTFASVVLRKWFSLPATRYHHAYLWRNRNLLLSTYPHVIGIKPGWTPTAGQCLLFEALHGKQELIGVALDSSPVNQDGVFIDAAKLLNWGFGIHEPVKPPPGQADQLGPPGMNS